MFRFVIARIFVRGRTAERTLLVNEQGIFFDADNIDARLPWASVKEVRDSGTYILIEGRWGNSFFVPSGAFRGAEERKRFLSAIRRWHRAA